MSAPIGTQLREYTTLFEAELPALDLDDVLNERIGDTPVRALRPRRLRERHWGAAVGVAVAAAVITILATIPILLVELRGDAPPVIEEPPVTTVPQTTSTSTSTTLSILVPAPESLTRPQMEHQVEFLSAFEELGFLESAGCSGGGQGPFTCEATVYSPTLGGPAAVTFAVADEDPSGQDPGEESGPDDMQQGSSYAAAVRGVSEEGLGALYLWAREAYPEETGLLCRSGFSGDDEYVAWDPGYVANYECGAHLAGHLVEFNPDEALPWEQLDTTGDAGIWYPVAGAVEGTDGERWDHVLFDLADTPYGFIGTSGKGLWISPDGRTWEPYARDAVTFGPGGEPFARVASSELGVLVVEPTIGPGAWHTSDGRIWQAVNLPSGFSEGASARIAASDLAYVVAAQGRIWKSKDGIEWADVILSPDVFIGGNANISTLEATPFGLVAGGTEERPGGSRLPVVWQSVDGITWTRQSIELGEPRSADDWIYDLAGSELGIVAVTKSGAIWFSEDGASWEEALSGSGLGAGEDHTVGASDFGFIVASDGGYGGLNEPRVLASSDGTTWTVAELDEPPGRFPKIPGEFGMIMREAVPLSDGFLIATEGGTSPVHIYEP